MINDDDRLLKNCGKDFGMNKIFKLQLIISFTSITKIRNDRVKFNNQSAN